MNDSIISINLETSTAPIVQEVRGRDYIEYGTDDWKNLYPQFLIDLYYNSSTHAAIINGTAEMIAGENLVVTDDDTSLDAYVKLKKFMRNANSKESLHQVIKKVATSGLIANGSCDFTNAGDVTLTERIIQPEEFQVNLELCKTPFVSDWEAVQMGYSAFEKMPPKFSDFLIGQISAEVAAKNETNIWNGANASAGEYDGLVPLFKADADVSDI